MTRDAADSSHKLTRNISIHHVSRDFVGKLVPGKECVTLTVAKLASGLLILISLRKEASKVAKLRVTATLLGRKCATTHASGDAMC